jgi:hypothetical protein
MAEALVIVGAIAGCDQLIKRFTSLYRKLSKAYKVIRHTRKDIEDVKSRTKTIGKLWRFF